MNAASRSIRAKAAVLHQVNGNFALEDVEVESPRADEVRVRMVGVGVCHTDLAVRAGFPVPLPIVLGHEGSGVVEAVGPSVKRIKPGDHVVLTFGACYQCPSCRNSHPAFCFNVVRQNFSGARPDGTSPLSQNGAVVYGQFFRQSSFSTYAIAHETNAIVVSKDLPLELLGPLGCGVQTGAGTVLNTLALKAGESLAIFGGGAVGLSALLAAKAVGAGTTVVIEPNVARAQLARDLGATHTINPKETSDVLATLRQLTDGGVSHAIDTTAIPAVINVAVESTLSNGTVALVGTPAPDATLTANLLSLLVRGTGIKYVVQGDSVPQQLIPRLAGLYREGKFPFDRLIKTFSFDRINDAVQATESGAVIKPVLVF